MSRRAGKGNQEGERGRTLYLHDKKSKIKNCSEMERTDLLQTSGEKKNRAGYLNLITNKVKWYIQNVDTII